MAEPVQGESKVTIVTREGWGAKEPNAYVPLMQYKAYYVTFSFNTLTEGCDTREECIKTVREIQRREMEEEGLADISYNFLLGNDGNVYEGRGWNKRAAFVRRNPPTEHPEQTLDIAFIGNYTDKPWLYDTFELGKGLISYGVYINKVRPSFKFTR